MMALTELRISIGSSNGSHKIICIAFASLVSDRKTRSGVWRDAIILPRDSIKCTSWPLEGCIKNKSEIISYCGLMLAKLRLMGSMRLGGFAGVMWWRFRTEARVIEVGGE